MSVLYLVFRALMRKQTFFQLNRVVLLSIVGLSLIIPFVYLPQTIQPVISFQLPMVYLFNAQNHQFSGEAALTGIQFVDHQLQMIYLSGFFVVLLASFISFLRVIIFFRKSSVLSKNGFQLLIARGDIPAFSIGHYVIISQSDFDTNREAILTHEKAHIRFGHFYDLFFLELVKIIFWFNPVIYLLIKDLKSIHEFQADDSTLKNGIDATKYQLLIIQKCVGHQKFALANSFNHCQIKNRIVMMNKQKTNKGWSWKAAAFIPMLALLLMAFGRTGENVSVENSVNKDFLIQKKVNFQDTTRKTAEKVYSEVEEMPQFPGGMQALMNWIGSNTKYPAEAVTKGIQGKVFVSFVVNSEGVIENAKIERSVDPALDAEAIRVISSMPSWIPAKQKGKPVSASMTIPINFNLK